MDLTQDDAVYKIAINMIPGVGSASIRELVAACQSERNIFENLDDLVAAGAVPQRIAQAIRDNNVVELAKRQVELCHRHNINMLYFRDNDFPRKLASCDGAPSMLYSLGKLNYDRTHTLGIVGTRACDGDGKANILSLVEALKDHNINIIIISGLASGADTFAHQAALKFQLPTAAVLGHGLNMVYPAENRKLAADIVHSGGSLVTEYYFGESVCKGNFPRRNRIIAGLCDAILVAQSKSWGGALITANVARTFRREVFAFPGRISDKLYAGCNSLIARNEATLITSADDLEKNMGWNRRDSHEVVQTSLNLEPLSDIEIKIIDILRNEGITNIDTLSAKTGIPMFSISATLLNMEIKDLVTGLPGKKYEVK